jgi:hypothetical protein
LAIVNAHPEDREIKKVSSSCFNESTDKTKAFYKSTYARDRTSQKVDKFLDVKIDKQPSPRKHKLNHDTSIDVIRSKSTLTRLHKVDAQLDVEV